MQHHPCLNVPSAVTSGEKAVRVQAKEQKNHPPEPHCALQPPSLASTRGHCGELQEHCTRASSLWVPPPLSIFHREAVKQLQFIMSCAVAGQTTHRKAWFAGTKLLSKLEAFPEKCTVQDEDPHNLVTIAGTNSARKNAHL